jgi:hypothetical protein
MACWCQCLLLPRRLAPVDVLQQVPPAPDEAVIRKLPAVWVHFAEALQRTPAHMSRTARQAPGEQLTASPACSSTVLEPGNQLESPIKLTECMRRMLLSCCYCCCCHRTDTAGTCRGATKISTLAHMASCSTAQHHVTNATTNCTCCCGLLAGCMDAAEPTSSCCWLT